MRRTLPWIVALLVVLAAGWFWSERLAGPEPASLVPSEATSQPRAASQLVVDAESGSVPARTNAESTNDVNAGQRAATAIDVDLLRGLVVDDLGAPVTQFEIELTLPSRYGVVQVSPIESAVMELGPSATRTAFSNADGAFAVARPEGECQVTALRASGVRSNAVSVGEADRGPLKLVLPRSARLTGIVLASDAPVAGAHVHIRSYEQLEHGEFDASIGPPRAITGADGRFDIAEAQSGNFLVVATAERFAESEPVRVSVLPSARADVVVKLAASARIVGRVDPSLGNVADRRIDLFSFRGQRGWRSARTDTQGGFVMEDVIPQKYVIELRPPGYPAPADGDAATSVRKNIEVREGETCEVAFGERRTALRVAGKVTRGGRLAPGVEVRVTSNDGGENRPETPLTDEAGRFELMVDGPGAYDFWFSIGPFSSVRIERTIAATPGAMLEFVLPAGSISGVVLSPDGKPLERVPVTVERAAAETPPDPAKAWSRYQRTYSDADGRFVFELLEPGEYVLRAPDGFWRDSPPPRTPFGGVVVQGLHVGETPLGALTVKLEAEGRIRGRVTEASGATVANAAIQAYDAAGVARLARWELVTNGDGVFEIVSLAQGTYTVGAQLSGRRGTSTAVRVVAGEVAEATVELPR